MVSASSLLLTFDLESAIAPPLLTAAPTTLVTDAIALLSTLAASPPVAAHQDALNVPSSRYARCLVVDDAQLVGLFSERDVTRLVADGRSLIGVPLAEVVEPPVVTIRQVELTTPDAALKLLRQHDVQYLPVLNDNGQVVGLLTSENLCRLLQPVERDQQLEQSIAELQLQTERSQLLMAVSARIRASLSLTETLDATVAEVRQFLGCDRVSIYRFNEKQQFQVVAESLAANQRSFVGEAIHDPCFAPAWAAQYGKGRVRVVADIYTVGMTPCHIKLLERLQIRAKILIPVIIDNQFWGLVSASESADPRLWQPSEVTFLEELAIQVTIAIQQSQTATLLHQQRQELEVLLDRAPDIIFRLDRDLHYLYVNAAVEPMLGYTPEALIGQPSLVFTLAPEYLAEWMALTQRVAATGQEETIEYQLQMRTHALWVQTRVAPEYGIDEAVTSFLCVARNITQRKQAEAKQAAYINILLEWQNRHHAAQQASGQVLYEWDTATDHVTWGTNADAVFGYSAAEMPQTSAAWFANIHLEDLQGVQTAVTEYLEHREQLHLRYRWQHQDGHYIWIETQGQFFADVSGNLTRIIGYVTDISEKVQLEADRTQLETALRESEAQLRQIFDNSEDVFFLKSLDGEQMVYTSPAWEDVYQTPLQQTYDNPRVWFDFVHPADRDRMSEFNQQMCQGETFEPCEYRIVRPDSSVRWLWTRTFPIRNEVGEAYRVAGINTDITDRKQAEEALQKSQQRLRLAIQAAKIGYWQLDPIRETLVASSQCKANFGLSAEDDFSYTRLFELMHPDDRAHVVEQIQQAIATHIDYQAEYRIIWPDGKIHWIYALGKATYHLDGSPLEMSGITLNISDRKQAEAELRESEELNQRILESSQDSIKVLTLDGNLLYINDSGLCSLEDDFSQPANTNWLSLWQGDALAQAEAAIAAAKAGKVGRFSGYCPTLKETPRWWDVAVTPLRDAAGQVIKLVVVSRDITEQKQAEVALRESEQTLSHVINTVPGAVYKYLRLTNAADRFVFMSQGIVDLYEQTPEEIFNDSSIAWDIILPEDAEPMSASIDRSAATLEPWKFEFRIRTASGVLKWILGQSIPSQQTDGSIIWCGILTDISDRKRSEQALRESEQRYRDLAEAMPQMVWLADATGAVHYFNQRWYDYTGLSEAASMGLGAVDAIHPDERDRTLQEWAQVTTTGEIFDIEYRLRHHKGLYHWFIARGLPIQNLAGDITGWVCTITDIDAFKQAVLAQQQSEARFRAVFEQAAVGITEVDIEGRFLRVNQRYCDLLGYAEAELLERDFHSLTLNATELELDLCHSRQLLASEIDSFTIEKRVLCKNGALRWCQVTVSPVFNVSGTIAYCLAIVQDIQDRKQAELARQASEDRLNDVLSSAGASIGHFRFYENGAWETEYHSNGSEQIFGYAPEDFLAETWLSGIAAEDWHAIHKPMFAAIKAETEITLEYRFYHPDGSTRWISDTVTSRWKEDDRCWVVTAIGTDVSDRKLAELALQHLNHELEARITRRTAALSESERRYRALFEQAAVGISQCHLSGKYLQVNQRFCDLTGYTQAELLKMSWRDLIHPDDLTANQIELAQLYQGELVSMTAESRYIRKDGQPQWVSFTVSLLYDVTGAPISDLTVVEDISDRKEIERRLQTSEKRLKEIISKTVDGILILNPQGQILFGNPAAEKIFDCQQPYCQGALLGIPITLQKTFELDIPHRDGSLCTVEVRVEEITWQDKKAFLAAARDISQRRQDQIALQASELSYRTLAENLPGLVYKLYPSQNNKLVFFNDRLTTLCQLDPADLAKQNGVCPMNALIVPEDHDRVIETIQAAIANQQPFQIEYGIHIPTTQEKRYFLEQGSTVIDDIGQTLHIVGVIFDVTESKQTEEQLRKINERLTITNAELARATRLKDEFLANMSHELRTPLNSVLGLSEVLQERIYGDLTEQQQRALTTIQTNGQHLLALINDILDLAKIESGKLELQMTPVSVQQLCRSTIPFIQQQAFKKQISFSLNLASDLVYIEVDERLIRQALINLLTNAVKFTPSGGSVTLTVQGNAAEQSLSFSVIDTGIGIAPENIDKLFQPFIQIDSSLSRRYSGTGLGLALVRRIVELHEGIVTVCSTVGQGSQFTMLLPWKHAHPPNRAKILSDTVAAAKIDAKPLPVEIQNTVEKPIVLLVEDNLDNIETLTAYLDLKGFKIVVARNGLQATQLAQAQSINLILMDIQMPDMDGLEAIRQIRSQEQDRHIPILAVTALAMPGDKEKCLAAGADDYLTKPISPIHLVSTMKKYL